MKVRCMGLRIGAMLKRNNEVVVAQAATAAIEPLETRCLMSSYSAAVLADAPRGYFQLNESGASQFALNNPSATGGSTLVGQYYNNPDHSQPGIAGTAGDTATQFNVNGLNQDVHNIQDSKTYSGLTVEAWVRPTQTNNQGILVNTNSAGVYTDWTFNLRIINIAGRPHFAFYTFDGAGKMFVASQEVVAGNLYHLAATAKNGRASALYINGAKAAGTYYSNGVAQPGVVAVGTLANYKTWFIGSVVGGDGLDPFYQDFFHGTIDEVAMYPVRLTSEQIANHYTVGAAASPAGTITGTIFEDVNGNSSGGVGEGPLAGWTVFLDTDRDGQLDVGELSTATNSGGVYTFNGVVPGSYRLQEVIPSGWIGVSPRFGSADVTVTASQITRRDFAAARPIVISGSVFGDINHDGIRNGADSGIQGETVYLDINNDGTPNSGDFITTTNANGGYTFAQLPPATYVLRVETHTSLSIATSPRVLTLAMISGQVLTDLNIGFR